jgi:hypothetical protein
MRHPQCCIAVLLLAQRSAPPHVSLCSAIRNAAGDGSRVQESVMYPEKFTVESPRPLTYEEIQGYVAKGRRARSDAVAAAIGQAWRALRRRMADGQPKAHSGYRVAGKLRP